MSRSAVKVIGITIGDPAGIGPEVTSKALAKLKNSQHVSFVIIGDEISRKKYFSRLAGHSVYCCVGGRMDHKSFSPGKTNRLCAKLSYAFLEKSAELLKSNMIQAVVTAPVSKESINAVDPHFVGHTEFYAGRFGIKKYDMMFVSEEFKSVIVTRHVPLIDVPKLLTKQKILDSIVLVNGALQKYFGIRRPSIAVCGLNPHAGEGGKIGSEEKTVIIPAIAKARQLGVEVAGPFAGDTMFIPRQRKAFDTVICMYHDQGLIAIKSLHFDSVVNLTIGLPFVRTSPAHGTAFDIAGRGRADASSMVQAINLAISLSS